MLLNGTNYVHMFIDCVCYWSELNMFVFHMTWDVSYLPSVPYIYFADNDVAQSSANTERGEESSQRRAFPPALKRKLFHATGELMTPSIVHGDILLLVVLVSSCAGGWLCTLSVWIDSDVSTCHRSRTYILQTMTWIASRVRNVSERPTLVRWRSGCCSMSFSDVEVRVLFNVF